MRDQTIERRVSWNKKIHIACEVRQYQTFKCHHRWNYLYESGDEQRRRTNYDEGPGNNTRLKESQTTLNTDKKTKGIFYFKWEGDELVIDNKNSPNYEKPEHP